MQLTFKSKSVRIFSAKKILVFLYLRLHHRHVNNGYRRLSHGSHR